MMTIARRTTTVIATDLMQKLQFKRIVRGTSLGLPVNFLFLSLFLENNFSLETTPLSPSREYLHPCLLFAPLSFFSVYATHCTVPLQLLNKKNCSVLQKICLRKCKNFSFGCTIIVLQLADIRCRGLYLAGELQATQEDYKVRSNLVLHH